MTTVSYTHLDVYKRQPYGYMKDPDNKKQWIVDEEAAEVVKQIFALCLDGYGPSQIARILKEDKIITPTIHFQQTGRATRNAPPDNPFSWTGDTIADILERPEYQGHTVNFKTYKQMCIRDSSCVLEVRSPRATSQSLSTASSLFFSIAAPMSWNAIFSGRLIKL